MGESARSNFSLLSNNIRLLSYIGALSLPPRRAVEKYYFIKNKVSQGEITIEHCPTEDVDRHQYQTETRLGVLHVQGTRYGHLSDTGCRL